MDATFFEELDRLGQGSCITHFKVMMTSVSGQSLMTQETHLKVPSPQW